MESTRPIRALIRGLDALTVLNLRNGATVSEVAQPLCCACARISSGITAEACFPGGYFSMVALAHTTFSGVKLKAAGWSE